MANHDLFAALRQMKDDDTESVSSSHLSRRSSMSEACANCGELGANFPCNNCKSVYYCTMACLRNNAVHHRRACFTAKINGNAWDDETGSSDYDSDDSDEDSDEDFDDESIPVRARKAAQAAQAAAAASKAAKAKSKPKGKPKKEKPKKPRRPRDDDDEEGGRGGGTSVEAQQLELLQSRLAQLEQTLQLQVQNMQLAGLQAAPLSAPSLSPPPEPKEYTVTWTEGDLGISFVRSKNNTPAILVVTERASETIRAVVKVNDELIALNDKSTAQNGFDASMKLLRDLPKPVILRFSRVHSASSRSRSSPSRSSGEGEVRMYTVLWQDGPLGIVLTKTADSRPMIKRLTGKGTSSGLEHAAQGDILTLVNNKVCSQIGYKAVCDILTSDQRPVVMQFSRLVGGKKSRSGGERRRERDAGAQSSAAATATAGAASGQEGARKKPDSLLTAENLKTLEIPPPIPLNGRQQSQEKLSLSPSPLASTPREDLSPVPRAISASSRNNGEAENGTASSIPSSPSKKGAILTPEVSPHARPPFPPSQTHKRSSFERERSGGGKEDSFYDSRGGSDYMLNGTAQATGAGGGYTSTSHGASLLSSRSASSSSDSGAEEYTVVWAGGPLGIAFQRDEQRHTASVKRLTGKGSREVREKVAVGDLLLSFNSTSAFGMSYTEMMESLAKLDKPIILRFQKLRPSQIATTLAPPLSQSPSSQSLVANDMGSLSSSLTSAFPASSGSTHLSSSLSGPIAASLYDASASESRQTREVSPLNSPAYAGPSSAPSLSRGHSGGRTSRGGMQGTAALSRGGSSGDYSSVSAIETTGKGSSSVFKEGQTPPSSYQNAPPAAPSSFYEPLSPPYSSAVEKPSYSSVVEQQPLPNFTGSSSTSPFYQSTSTHYASQIDWQQAPPSSYASAFGGPVASSPSPPPASSLASTYTSGRPPSRGSRGYGGEQQNSPAHRDGSQTISITRQSAPMPPQPVPSPPIHSSFPSSSPTPSFSSPSFPGDEYSFHWTEGPLGITMKKDGLTGLPCVRRLTGRSVCPEISKVNKGDLLIRAGGSAVEGKNFDEIINLLGSAVKPVTLVFRRPYDPAGGLDPRPTEGQSSAPNSEVLLRSNSMQEGQFNTNWLQGPLGLSLYEDDVSHLPVVSRLTGKGNYPDLALVSPGDILLTINGISTWEIGFEQSLRTLKTLSKPVLLRWQKRLALDSMEAEI